MTPDSRSLVHRGTPQDCLAPCCEETSAKYDAEGEAAAELAKAVREFLAGTPYRHTPPTQAEKTVLARALGAYEREVRHG